MDLFDNLEIEEPSPKVTDGKLEKNQRAKDRLFSSIASHKPISKKEKIAYILNYFPETRNSDVELAWRYWNTFDADKLKGTNITKELLYDLTRQTDLVRFRAKIQNEYFLFEADTEVKSKRKKLELERNQEVISDKPNDLPNYSVYIDESGKTGKFLLIGSLWMADMGSTIYATGQALDDWKKQKGISYEFHFKKVNNSTVGAFKEFFAKFWSLNPTVGFKMIVINNASLKNKSHDMEDLTFHLLREGIQHEHDSGRAPLPRELSVWIDEEEKGSDKLKIANLKARLTALKHQKLYLESIATIDSKKNYYVQAIDLCISAVNRKLNTDGSDNHKDELAEYILGVLKFDVDKIDKEKTLDNIDQCEVFDWRTSSVM